MSSELWAEVRVNGYGYRVLRQGHVFVATRLEPGGVGTSEMHPAESLRLLANIAELADPRWKWEAPRA